MLMYVDVFYTVGQLASHVKRLQLSPLPASNRDSYQLKLNLAYIILFIQ